MFELLMLLGFFYAGFCYLLPEAKQPSQPTAMKRIDDRLLCRGTRPKPRKVAPHLALSSKRCPGAQDGQRKLFKADRLC
ncbi:hypothetical protein [Trichloromonas sp.]|uniref:hypothetical protein n=1 Tax=Trichloromonas sp. TaxID=3069249 RepID=UPI003D813FDB